MRQQGMLGVFQGGFSHSRSTQVSPRWAEKPQSLEWDVRVSHGRPPQAKTGLHGGVGGWQGLRETLMQAEGRSGENAGNARSLSKWPLPTQNLPGLSWAGYKAPGIEAGCLCLWSKAPTSENGAAVWHGKATGTQEEVETGSDEKRRDCRLCWDPPKNASPILEAPRSVQRGL